jgi:putative photosynthetic complex assembly protein
MLLRSPALVAAALLAVLVAGVAVVRIANLGTSYVSTSSSVHERALRFDDLADGSISVTDDRTGRAVARFAPGSNGFVRGALRGLARERKRQGGNATAPFILASRSDGRLTLDDPITKRQIDLRSFGHTNAQVFEQLLYIATKT